MITQRIKIYRSLIRHGSIIETELIDEFDTMEVPDDLQELTEFLGGDFVVVENNEYLEIE